MIPCYIFDLDGTLCDGSHRLHHIQKSPKDWKTYFSLVIDDQPIKHMVDLVRVLQSAGEAIVYVSGRSDECRHTTQAWLNIYRLPAGPL